MDTQEAPPLVLYPRAATLFAAIASIVFVVVGVAGEEIIAFMMILIDFL